MSGTLFLNSTILTIGLTVLLATIVTWARDDKHWHRYVPVTTWSAHLSAFYIVTILRAFEIVGPSVGQLLHGWSTILRLHSMLTIGCLIYIIRLKDKANG